MKNKRKAGVALAIAAGAVVSLSSCGYASPNADEVSLIYDAGAFSKTTFQECVEPGHRGFAGPGDQTYSYTAGQISYDFTGEKGAESNPLRFVSQDNQEMSVTGVVTLNLNTNCDVLRKFHETIGRRKNMYNEDGHVGDGWVPGLNLYIGQPLQRALQDAGQQFGWEQLRADGNVRAQMEAQVAKVLPGLVAGSTTNGKFFEGFKVTINKPTPTNTALVDQLNAKAAAEAQIATIQAQKAAQDAQIGQIQQLVQTLGPDGYILYKAQQDCEQQKPGCVPFLPVPQGAGINVTVPK